MSSITGEKKQDTASVHQEYAKDAAPPTEPATISLREAIQGNGSVLWWTFFFAMSAIGWGFDAQVNGAMISVPAFRRDFGYLFEDQYVIPADWQSAFNIISAVGQFFGGFGFGWLSDKIGRRGALATGVIICCGGIIGQLLADTRPAFLISKLILGAGLGAYLTIGPLYCSEVSPVSLRGITTAGINLGIVVGQLLSNAAVKGFGERTDRWAYRAPFALQLIFVAFLLGGLPFAPESPWYLVRKGKLEEAAKSCAKLYPHEADIDARVASIKQLVDIEIQEDKGTWLDCFRGTDLIRTGISTGVFACQHLVGIIFVLGFSGYFFQLAGLSVSKSFDMGVGVTACGVLGNFLSWFVVNNYGRRKVFVQGMAVLTLILMLIGIMDVIPTGGAKWAQAALTVIYAFVYFMTIGAMAFVLLGEVSAPSLRAKTMGLAAVTQSVFGIAMNFAIPYMVNPDSGNLKGKVGFVFGGLGLMATIGSYFYVPELKGKTFTEIDSLFQAKVAPRKMGDVKLGQETRV
ncbi:maltose permease [Leptodontidium sp. 2 PMI_412]|nr:maltose permease [Leptodontidium sp. MPI-SDFR-AT-0119]KAH9216931.1 maltose permease [Leptodontidium sp. 2 PMI_412]